MNGTNDYQQARLSGPYTEAKVIPSPSSIDEKNGLSNQVSTMTQEDALKAMVDAKFETARGELEQMIKKERTEFNKKLEAEQTARIKAERRVKDLAKRLDAERSARIEMERRQVMAVAQLLKSDVQKFLVDELEVRHEGRYDCLTYTLGKVKTEQKALQEKVDNLPLVKEFLRVEEESKNALQKKVDFLISEVGELVSRYASFHRRQNRLNDLMMKGLKDEFPGSVAHDPGRSDSSLFDSDDEDDEEGDALQEKVDSLSSKVAKLVKLYTDSLLIQKKMNDKMLERLKRFKVAIEGGLQDRENRESPVQEFPGSVAHDPGGSESPVQEFLGSVAHNPGGSDFFLVVSDSLSDGYEGSESKEDEEDDEEGEGADENDIVLSSDHDTSPGYFLNPYEWGWEEWVWEDDDEHGTMG